MLTAHTDLATAFGWVAGLSEINASLAARAWALAGLSLLKY